MKWEDFRYFKSKEFDSPDDPGSGSEMDKLFVARLDQLRDTVGEPLRINSGFRTEKRNASAAVKGKKNSAHLRGLAADILCTNSKLRFKILLAAVYMGFQRIGIGKTFIHLDDDSSLPREVIWLY